MKKLYIVLAVVLVCISAALIYFANTSSNADDANVREKIREEMKEKGFAKPGKVYVNPKRTQMDKDTIRKMIMIRNKDKKLELNKEINSLEAEKKAQPVESVEKKEKK